MKDNQMEIGTVIFKDGGVFEVWVGPSGDMADRPVNIINAFVAGIGATRDEAVADAVRNLEALTEHLQSPAGVVFEQDLNVPRPPKPQKERPFPQGLVTNG
jgi:hypothetical protein